MYVYISFAFVVFVVFIVFIVVVVFSIYIYKETIMVRKRNMNKKRSQVAHYVKCELLVARRPLTIFSLSSCVRCRCLFHLFHFIRCRFEICVLCMFGIPPPNGRLFFICFIRFSFVQLFFFFVRSFGSFIQFLLSSLPRLSLYTFLLLLLLFLCR